MHAFERGRDRQRGLFRDSEQRRRLDQEKRADALAAGGGVTHGRKEAFGPRTFARLRSGFEPRQQSAFRFGGEQIEAPVELFVSRHQKHTATEVRRASSVASVANFCFDPARWAWG